MKGWGATSSGGPSSDKLLEVEVPIVSNSVCDAAVTIADVRENNNDCLNKLGLSCAKLRSTFS